MGIKSDNEFNLEGWGSEKRLIEGHCAHCHHAVAFKQPEQHTCLQFNQTITKGDDDLEYQQHFFIMGLCPRPCCQQATIVYRQERQVGYQGYRDDVEILQERVIFPATSERVDLTELVPINLRDLYREASSIEHLSPNGSAFLARRILEQTLRTKFNKPRGKLYDLIEEFLQKETVANELHQMMHDIREFGNIAGHPAQDQNGDWTAIDIVEATYTLDVVAELLDYIFVKPAYRSTMRERWKLKKQGKTPPIITSSKIVIGGRDLSQQNIPNEEDIPF